MEIAHLGFEVNPKGLISAEKSLDKVDRAGARVEKRGKAIGSSFKSLAGIFAGIGLGALAVDTFRAAASMQTMNASLKTVLGSAEKAATALDEIKEFAKTTPFDLEQSVKGFIKLKALGLDPSIASLRSYGNTAAAMGKSLNQAVEAVADAATGEFERLKEFGIKAKSQGDLVTFTFQGVATTVKKEASAIEGYLQGIGNNNFGSAMADQMDTLGAQTSNLRGAFFELQVAFFNVNKSGDGLAGSAGGAIKSLTNLLESDGAIAAVEALGRGLVILIDVTALALTGVSEIFSTLEPIYTQVSVAFDDLFSSGNDVIGVMDVLKGVLTDSKLVGIALVTGLLTGFEDIKGGVRIAGEAIKLAFVGSFDLVLEAYAGMISKIGQGFAAIGLDGQAESLANFSSQVSNIITPLDNYNSAVARIRQETELSKRAIEIITDSQADLVIQTKLAAKETSSLITAFKKSSKSISENNGLVASNEKALKDAAIQAKRLAKATGTDLLKSQKELNDILDEGALFTKNYEKALDQAREAILSRGLIEGTDAYEKALNDLGFRTDELADKTKKGTTTIAELWTNTVGTVQDTLFDLFKNGKGGFDNWFDSILDKLKSFLAAFAAQWAASKILSFFGGGSGGGGFNFGGGGGGFSFGGGSGGGSGGGGGAGLVSAATGISYISGILGGPTIATLTASAGASIASALGITTAATTAATATAAATAAAAAATTAATVAGTAAVATAAGAAGATAAGAGAVAAAGAAGAAGAGAAAAGASGAAGSGASAALASNPYGWIALAVLAVIGLASGNSRSPQELGEDQLKAVDEATRAGRNENVQLGQAAGTSVSFIGGFDENSTFFGIDLAKDKLQEVGNVLERFGFDQALALKDGVLRLEDFSRNFSENNERIVAEVQSAIVEVNLSVTELERNTIGSLGSTLVEIDRLFDSTADSGESNADRLAKAYSQAFDTTIQAGHDWVESTQIDTDRIAELFDNSSAGVTEALFGVLADGTQAFNELAVNATNNVDSIAASIGSLGIGALNTFGLIQGGLSDIEFSARQAEQRFNEQSSNLTVVQGGNNGDNSEQASQQQQETNEALNRAAKALEETAPFIQQIAAGGR